MRARPMNALIALALAAPLAAAGFGPGLTVQPQSRLWIEGTSTVRSFTCRAPEFAATVETTSPDAVGMVLAGEKAVSGVAIRVPAATIDCGNATMNSHMFRALKAAEHPTITFRLASYELARTGEGAEVRMSGRLTIGGTERAVALEAAAHRADGGMLRVTGTEEILLSDYGLRAPSLMMGTMKVGDAVKVGYEILLRP